MHFLVHFRERCVFVLCLLHFAISTPLYVPTFLLLSQVMMTTFMRMVKKANTGRERDMRKFTAMVSLHMTFPKAHPGLLFVYVVYSTCLL